MDVGVLLKHASRVDHVVKALVNQMEGNTLNNPQRTYRIY
jgi:hypothetical protein